MTERVKKLRKQLLDVKPALSIERLRLETEAAKMFSGAPTPIYRAKILEYVLQHKTVRIYDGELLVGTVTEKVRAADIFPEYASGKLWLYETLPMISQRPHDPFEISPEEVAEAIELLHYWDGKATEELTLAHIPQYLLDHENAGVYKSGNKGSVSGHVHPNYRRMMEGGFRKQIQRCKDLIEEATYSGMTVEKMHKVEYWEATIIVLEAFITYAHRLADEAERQAAVCGDEVRRAELAQIAAICRKVPENAPETFREALQFQWFIEVGLNIEANSYATGLGRFDVNLGHYLEEDKKKGLITDEEVRELLELLFIKVTAIVNMSDNYYSRADAGYPMWQILMIGGVDENGSDVTNDLSYLVLEAASERSSWHSPPWLSGSMTACRRPSSVRALKWFRTGRPIPPSSAIRLLCSRCWIRAVPLTKRATGSLSAASNRIPAWAIPTAAPSADMSAPPSAWKWRCTTASIR